MRNNLHGTFLFSREGHRAMDGKLTAALIVNMLADIWGGLPGMGHSGAARGGVLTFTETAACEWGHSAVRVNAVAPGWIASNGMDSLRRHSRTPALRCRRRRRCSASAPSRAISSAVVYLLSDASAFVSGSVIRVDGAVPTARHTWPLQAAARSQPYQGFPQYRPPAMLDDPSDR